MNVPKIVLDRLSEDYPALKPGCGVSFSNNACILRFSGGGPYDGQSGMFDCEYYNGGIYVPCAHLRQNFCYEWVGHRHYALKRIYKWGE